MNYSNQIEEYFKVTSFNIDPIVTELTENNVRLDKLFECLETHLTSKDTQERSKSIKFIAELIGKLPSKHLNSIEIDHLSTFLCSKLDDHYTVSTAALPALKNLLEKQCETTNESNSISKEKSLDIIKSILRDVHVQSMVQADRFIVFNMCKYFLSSSNLIAICKSENYDTDFVYGFIQSMDGEKDPRNLLVCFDCIKIFCENLRLGPFVEETFEVFACYFPIDFNPPKNDNFTITKQMLIDSLSSCFASTGQFSKFAIPIFLEKLNSSVEESQWNALVTFTQCAKRAYDPNDFKEYVESLWSSFQKVVMNGSKTYLEEAALAAIEALASSISRTVQTSDSDNFEDSSSQKKPIRMVVSIDVFIEKAIQSCFVYLNEPDLKLVWPNVKCLHALASASSTANLLISKKTIPLLIEHYNNASLQNQKKTYLDILWQFVSNSKKFEKKESKVLKENINTLVEICMNNESNKHLYTQSLNGFYQLLKFENLIELALIQTPQTNLENSIKQSNFYLIAQCLWHSLWISPINKDDYSNEERKLLVEIFYLLCNKDDDVTKLLFDSIDEALTECLVKCSINASNAYYISLEILEKFSDFYSNDENDSKKKLELIKHIMNVFERFITCINFERCDLEQLFSFFSCLKNSIEFFYKKKNSKEEIECFLLILDRCMNKLLDLILKDNYKNTEIISKISEIFGIYAINLEASDKSILFVENLFKTFSFQTKTDFKPLEIESPVEQKLKLNVLMNTICNLNKNDFKSNSEKCFIELNIKLFKLATEVNEAQCLQTQEQVNQISSVFYAALVNKIDDLELIDKELEHLNTILKNQIEDSTDKNIEKRLRCLNTWIWLTKALVLREHKLANSFTNKLIEWLDDPILAKVSSDSFDIILNENMKNCSIMTNKTSANIKLFYRQRFLNFVLNPLKEKFDSENPINQNQKPFYTMAVINMLNFLPKSILQKNIKLMLPMLLYSLNNSKINNDQLLLSSLKSFEILINEILENENQYFLTFTEEILNRLIGMCSYESNMNIRLLALKCLNNLAISLSPNKLIKYQHYVCKRLEKCLNDKKRLCRQMAVETRNRWFLLTTKNIEA